MILGGASDGPHSVRSNDGKSQHRSAPGFRSRFSHEVATLAKLESPRIVRIYDYDEQDASSSSSPS